jgi:steroid delta-isomerase-like uncharacterized protein
MEGSVTALDTAQQYFDAWNRRDPVAVLATMADGGTYADPTTGGPVTGEAFADNMRRLFSAFPDVSFSVVSAGLAAPDLVAAQWIMRGTNHGSMLGLPPTGKRVELHGADFIRVAGDRIQSVEGYFDSRAIPEQLGLQVIVQPKTIGPFTFGTSVRSGNGAAARPGAFSITALQSRGADDTANVTAMSRQIAAELPGMKGFLGFVGVTVGDRMLTITAWEHPDDAKRMKAEGTHGGVMKRFYGTQDTLGGGGYTAVFVPERINTMWARCPSCAKMVDRDARPDACTCGAALPAPFPYW